MNSVPDYWRNQHTTLDAKRAKAKNIIVCQKCGISFSGKKGRKYCRVCSYAPPLGARVRLLNPLRHMTPYDDLTGLSTTHGLQILQRTQAPRRRTNYWLVRCLCDSEFVATGTDLVTGKIRHCGCKDEAAA